ncbi:MAG: 5-(carboxyamino)imidazole ribonucleotide mutase [Gemmatimonadota bacterium]
MANPKKGETKAPLVGILTGSPSDLPTIEKTQETLEELGVPSELKVLSAHRTPDLTVEYVRSAELRGVKVFIACAGMANHLAGTVAAHTVLPVIGVPLTSGALAGLDALLSTVQMPPGVPVATVAVDGARNAAYLAAQILALQDSGIRKSLEAARAAARRRYEGSEGSEGGEEGDGGAS